MPAMVSDHPSGSHLVTQPGSQSAGRQLANGVTISQIKRHESRLFFRHSPGTSRAYWERKNGLHPVHQKNLHNISNLSKALGGAEGDRTPGLIIANDTLSQLSYCPVHRPMWSMVGGLSRRHACGQRHSYSPCPPSAKYYRPVGFRRQASTA